MTLFAQKKPRGRANAGTVRSDFAHQIFWGIIRIIGIALLFVLVWYVTRLDFFTIHEVRIVGGETISHSDIQARVDDELKGSYFLLIPKHFVYLYPHDRIVEVLGKTPRIHDVVVERSGRTTLNVTFAEYVPHALWCVYEKDDVPCYFVTEDGYAFSEAPSLQGSALVRHSVEGIDKVTSGNVIDAEKFAAIDRFIARAEDELDFHIVSVAHTKEGDIHFLVSGGGEVYATGKKDLDVTFENLKTVLTSSEFKHLAPGNFRYVDVRFDSKVFVNEEMGSTTENTSATST